MTGSGTLDLSGGYSYTGDTTVNAGILELDETGSIPGTVHIANGAVLNLNYSGTDVVAACYTNGVALPSGVYNSINLSGFITGRGSLTVSAATPPVVNHPVISGGNLILTGSGWHGGCQLHLADHDESDDPDRALDYEHRPGTLTAAGISPMPSRSPHPLRRSSSGCGRHNSNDMN